MLYNIKTIILLGCMLLTEGYMMATDTKLRLYRTRSNFLSFHKDSGQGHPSQATKDPIFVIQKHAASSLHYDFRLEIDGVLVSWAVPKGPAMSPLLKRLAMQTNNHALEYADFEGVIPEGYGAGTVMIWDKGTYRNSKTPDGALESMQEGVRNGHIEFFLHGQKLHGTFVLVRAPSLKHNGWLLIKKRDEYAGRWRCNARKRQRSVATGRTMLQIRRNALRESSHD